jgi:hypothetical protein
VFGVLLTPSFSPVSVLDAFDASVVSLPTWEPVGPGLMLSEPSLERLVSPAVLPYVDWVPVFEPW